MLGWAGELQQLNCWLPVAVFRLTGLVLVDTCHYLICFKTADLLLTAITLLPVYRLLMYFYAG
jgi:hypothetical protein